MCFWKSKIEKAFRFLIKNGFSLKKYLRAPDEEYVYSKNNIVLEVDYYFGMYPNGESSMCVAVILTAGGVRNNLLKCTNIFDGNLLENLKSSVDGLSPSEQISVYADFIETNIDTLLSL